jgi:hypothetical protein
MGHSLRARARALDRNPEGEEMGRRRCAAPALAAAAVAFAVAVATAEGGSSQARTATPLQLAPLTVTRVGTVDVGKLPAAKATGPQRSIPFLPFNAAAYAASKRAASGGSGAADLPSSVTSRPTIGVGTLLPSPLSSDDDPRWTPPDMGFAVSTGGLKMEQINTSLRTWDASNTPSIARDLGTFYLTGGDLISDPWVLYDRPTGRWFTSILDITLSSERIAVSQTADPTGLFNVYNVTEGDPGGCPDQGKLGLSDDVVALSANEFTSCFVNPVWEGPIVTILNKAEMVAGAATVDSAQTAPMPQYSSSVVPAQSLGSTTTQWFAGVDDASSTVAHIVKTTGTPPDPVTLSEPFTPTVKVVTNPPGADQPGTSTLLVTNDNRVQTVAWQANRLVFTETTGCTPPRDSAVRSCARVTSFSTRRGSIVFDKNRSKRGQHYFFPAASINANNTIVVDFGRSSTSIYPELDAAAASMAGGFAKPVVVEAGDAANETTRYGDYFSVAIDPDNPSNAWVAGEVGGHNSNGSAAWGTAVGEVLVSP